MSYYNSEPEKKWFNLIKTLLSIARKVMNKIISARIWFLGCSVLFFFLSLSKSDSECEYVKICTDVYHYLVDTGLWRKTEQTIYLACFCFSRNFCTHQVNTRKSRDKNVNTQKRVRTTFPFTLTHTHTHTELIQWYDRSESMKPMKNYFCCRSVW